MQLVDQPLDDFSWHALYRMHRDELRRVSRPQEFGAAVRAEAQAYLDQMDRTPSGIAAAHLTELARAIGAAREERFAS